MAASTQGTVRSAIPNAGHSSRVEGEISKYVVHYSEASSASEDRVRASHAAELAKSYYQVATDFYEYGWGESFHFAPIVGDSSLKECIAQFEKDIARELAACPGMKLLVSEDTYQDAALPAYMNICLVSWYQGSPAFQTCCVFRE